MNGSMIASDGDNSSRKILVRLQALAQLGLDAGWASFRRIRMMVSHQLFAIRFRIIDFIAHYCVRERAPFPTFPHHRPTSPLV